MVTIYHSHTERDILHLKLKELGIPTAIYYPIPLHLQDCFKSLNYKVGDLPVSEKAAQEVISLPINAFMKDEIDLIINKINSINIFKSLKLLLIVGARPQFIKASSIIREIKKYKSLNVIIVHTGQHYDREMSQIFFDELNITPPKYNLEVHEKNHGIMISKMISKLEKVFLKEKPNWIIVFGDTNSTLAGALAANKLAIKLAHIESGMRSYNKNMPEEINRILTDRLSNLLFCSSKISKQNLISENYNVNKYKILNVGDVMLDSIEHYKRFSKKPEINIKNNFILATIHRSENINNTKNLKNIFQSLNKISSNSQIIMPIHPNTKNKLKKLNFNLNKLSLISPVSYFEMIWLIQNCEILITDSGGLQKEAFFLNKICLTLRNVTEWIELIKLGVNFLAGTKKNKILKTYEKIIKTKLNFPKSKVYGSGKSSAKIIKAILKY